MRRIGRQLVVKPADRAAHRGDKGTRDPLRDAGFQMVEMRRLELLTLTCEVILGQKTLQRKRLAKGAKPHSHRGFLAFRISRSFRDFPRFSARMVVKWSSGARSAQARVLAYLDMLRADPDSGIR